MSILIICGSKSDTEVMKKAADVLGKKGVKCKMRICSAHRTPELLDKILTDDSDVIIAGAGLAAALPGVVASKTITPVIGVPLTGAFEGLDALLSIIQMPPGIPVLTTGINNAEEAAITAAKIAGNKARKANIVADKATKAAEKADATLKQLGIPYEISSKPQNDAINILFVDVNGKVEATNGALTIFCPTAEKETAADALKLMQLTKSGVWVGLNRGENAAIAAAEILGKNNEVREYRWNMKIKVEDADKEVKK